MKKSHFFVMGDCYVIFDVIFGDFLVGTGEPPPYCNKIPTKSPFCMVVVLVWKSWDWVRPPPPWDKIRAFTENLLWMLPLWYDDMMIMIDILGFSKMYKCTMIMAFCWPYSFTLPKFLQALRILLTPPESYYGMILDCDITTLYLCIWKFVYLCFFVFCIWYTEMAYLISLNPMLG